MLRVETDDDARAEMRSSLTDDRGRRLVVRNGHAEPRTITTVNGQVVLPGGGQQTRPRAATWPPPGPISWPLTTTAAGWIEVRPRA